MKQSYDVVIIGAGPAGLGAAIEAARLGATVAVIDENYKPGGQLFKQIHKFFGSEQHYAGLRGIDIGSHLLTQCSCLGIDTFLNTTAWGIFSNTVKVCSNGKSGSVSGRAIILACGATEKAISFPGWTLPGVIGAGAAQTIMNVHRVLPGKQVVMVGSGNVGLIVSYQLTQSGADVVCICEAASSIGGYSVHASKLRRAGVDICTRTTVKQAHPVTVEGETVVGSVTLTQVDDSLAPIPGTERTIGCDLVCLAVGLSPMVELALQAGCAVTWVGELGGHVPIRDEDMATTVKGIYVAGDMAGVEEASAALDEGRIAGISAASNLGLCDPLQTQAMRDELKMRLAAMRSGPLSAARKSAVQRVIDFFKQRMSGHGR